MVLTENQTTALFENANQMILTHVTNIHIQNEGNLTVADLAEDFYKDILSQIVDNLYRPGGCIPNATPGVTTCSTIQTPPFIFGAKSQIRLRVACDLICYYNTMVLMIHQY